MTTCQTFYFCGWVKLRLLRRYDTKRLKEKNGIGAIILKIKLDKKVVIAILIHRSILLLVEYTFVIF